MRIPRWQVNHALADSLVFLTFALVPVAASPWFLDQFTSVKWYVLEAMSVAWFSVERLLCGSAGWPAFVRRTRLAWLALGAFVLLGSLRRGFGWALEPLLARACFLLLALSSFWSFRRVGLRLTALRAGMGTAAAIVIALGLAQARGLRPLPWLTVGDQRSATFGNVNMAAEFLGLALVVLLSWRGGGETSSRWPSLSALVEILVAGGLAYLYLLGTRSAMLGLGGALLFLAGAGRLPIRPLLRAAVAAALLVVFVFRPGPRELVGPGMQAWKRDSAELRLAVWADTLRLIRDRPLGVGAGNFEHAFMPYALAGRSHPDESLVFRSPHNDVLRLLAEEGWIAAAILLGLLWLLVLRLRRSPAVDSWRSPVGLLLGSLGVFLATQACFQFPFEMASPALMTAVLLGLAWACLEPPTPAARGFVARRPVWRLAGGAVSLLVPTGILWGLGRVATAEHLFVKARDVMYAQEQACRLDPRRLDACVQAAWLRIRAGDERRARAGLVSVLDRSPCYFPAIKMLGEDSLARGDWDTGCWYLRIYDEMYKGRSSIHERVRRDCPSGDPEALQVSVPRPPCPVFPLAPADAALRPPAAPRPGCR
jgi:O-antigen ligase